MGKRIRNMWEWFWYSERRISKLAAFLFGIYLVLLAVLLFSIPYWGETQSSSDYPTTVKLRGFEHPHYVPIWAGIFVNMFPGVGLLTMAVCLVEQMLWMNRHPHERFFGPRWWT